MKPAAILVALALFTAACTATGSGNSSSSGPVIKLASWNMEHLAERNNSGCRPRTDADYAAMRAYVD
ncbi:MAG: endonuclease/exonuclease/phosphatase, partial [Alphaproteobacteria bacterium]|nr:endonuclease/exonuclease/phosphatase [Alphaproteobacteria bacterium]